MAGILGRSFPIRPHLAKPIVGAAPSGEPPLVIQVSVTQIAGRSSRYFRLTPRPQYARPIVSTVQPPLVVRALGVRVHRLRPTLFYYRVQRPRLAPPTLQLGPPVARGTFVNQSLERGHFQRTAPPRPHVAPPNLTPGPPVARGTFVYQATETSRFLRSTPRPHLAPANLTAAPPSSADPLVIQAMFTRVSRDRSLLRALPLRPHLSPPVITPYVPPAPPLHTRPVIISRQAILRARFRPHAEIHMGVADPGEAEEPPPEPTGDPLLWQLMVSQAVQAARRFRVPTPRPHLAPANLSPPPRHVQARITQTNRFLRITPRPHLAPPIVTPYVAPETDPPLVIQISITGQAVQRSRYFRPTPRPHTAPPITTAEEEVEEVTLLSSTIISQAVERSRLRRGVQRPQYARPNLTPASIDLLAGTFVYQAVERSRNLRLRNAPPRPHLAPVNLAPRPFRPGTFVYTAVDRAAIFRSRSAPAPHTARGLLPVVLAATGSGDWAWELEADAGGTSVITVDPSTQRNHIVGFDEKVGRSRHTRGYD